MTSPTVWMINPEDLATFVSEAVKNGYAEAKAEAKAQMEREMERPTLSRADAAQALGISLTTLNNWEKNGILHGCKVGWRKLYRRSDIEALLNPHRGNSVAQA